MAKKSESAAPAYFSVPLDYLRFITITAALLLAVFDAWAMNKLHITFVNQPGASVDFVVNLAARLAVFYYIAHFIRTWFAKDRLAAAIEFLGFSYVMQMEAFAFSYLAMAFSGPVPYCDGTLLKADQMLGYRWEVFSYWLASLPYGGEILRLAYLSIVPQLLCIIACTIYKKEYAQFYKLLLLLFISIMLCCVISAFFPAKGLFVYLSMQIHQIKYFSLGSDINVANTLDKLRSGGLYVIDIGNTVGVISFPSFHACVAVLLAYMFWSYRIRVLMLMLNMVMLISTLYTGGHYLVDVLAGVAVALLSICIIQQVFALVFTISSSAKPAQNL